MFRWSGAGSVDTHRRVPAVTKAQPYGFVGSASGSYIRNPRRRPSNPGRAMPAVIITFARCGTFVPAGV